MTIVATSAGRVRGSEIDDGILAWRGIPYAAPPVGELRLRPPQPARPWSGVRDAVGYGAPSLQPPPETQQRFGLPPGPELPPPDEDCLYLNVTAPAAALTSPEARRPVLVWVHGGGYQMGSGTDMAGEGKYFARSHGLVVVSFNYRLGALGFLAVDGSARGCCAGRGMPTGALGLHDQIAALRWVRANIAAFGGDPRRVTVYGLSSGAKSVANLMASPLARGLFSRAAFSSGGEHVATERQAAAVARGFFRELGAGPDRIRDVSAAEILAAQTAVSDGPRGTWLWRPMIDGVALTERPLYAIARGAAYGIPLLAQHCVDECALYQLGAPDAWEQAGPVLESYFGAAGREEILAAYAKARPDLADDPVRLGVEVMTDERYAIPTTRLADAQAARAPVYRSRYDGPVTGPPDAVFPGGPLPAAQQPLAIPAAQQPLAIPAAQQPLAIPAAQQPLAVPAMHGADGMPVWNGRAGLARLVHDSWGAFFAGDEPAADGLPRWPRYTAAARETMIFHADGPGVARDPRAGQRAAWDGREWWPGTWWAA